MKRFFIALSLLGLSSAPTLSAQNPVTTQAMGPQQGNVGGAPVSLNLSQHFTMQNVTPPMVRFDTVFGEYDVELLEDVAPNHVAKFLSYTDAGTYDETIIHRSAAFSTDEVSIVQGGAFNGDVNISPVVTTGSVDLELNLPNTRGTLAAARLGGDGNSASAGWYFNTEDNSEGLSPENPNGDGIGYTVYGRVLGGGMDVVDVIASVNRFNMSAVMGAAFAEIPLRFYTGATFPTAENLVMIHSVRRINMYPTVEEAGVLSFSATSSDESVVTVAINGSTLNLTPVSPGTATVTVRAEDVTGMGVEQEMVFSTGGVVVTAQPSAQDVAAGSPATFTVVAESDGPFTYQWYRLLSGATTAEMLAGATGASLTLADVQSSDMGFYWVTMVEDGIAVSSEVVTLTLTGGVSRLANLSTRGRIPAGGALTPGFVLKGTGNKSLVIRAVGPELLGFGVQAALVDPIMEIVPSGASETLASNDNWGDSANAAELLSTSASLGAFPLTAGSQDAALLTSLALPTVANSQGYTVRIKSVDATQSGIALAEVYDPDALGSGIELSNISALGFSGTDEDVLSPGFVIDGTGAKTMLIRVVGPSVAVDPYNVSGTMADPKLSLIPVGQPMAVATNDNWGGTAALKAAFATTGAFGFTDDDSLDAAVLVRLPPGGYTVKTEGADGGTGTVLVEAYEIITE